MIKEFIPKTPLSITAMAYISDINSQKTSISLHVRRGDYLTKDEYYDYGKKYYIKALSELASKGITGKIYVFSDDIKWCENTLSDLGNIVFVKGTASAFEDMWIMSKCHHNIIPNSTFSWWGAWLNTHPKKIVIMPKSWNTLGDSADILPMQSSVVIEGFYN